MLWAEPVVAAMVITDVNGAVWLPVGVMTMVVTALLDCAEDCAVETNVEVVTFVVPA